MYVVRTQLKKSEEIRGNKTQFISFTRKYKFVSTKSMVREHLDKNYFYNKLFLVNLSAIGCLCIKELLVIENFI